ncbi:hypothetical protein Goshw_010406 [Gossypium schwendimanii]|uniref:ATP-dependent Clp protease proteolytic subunit n=1 Tax=Gossypium schwendimanii TaxID=34291 RepID=A0A7J9LM89_GOSSC|nr:hypothetical protein [Gossypium schwendimanii]
MLADLLEPCFIYIQEKAVKDEMLALNTIRLVMGLIGTAYGFPSRPLGSRCSKKKLVPWSTTLPRRATHYATLIVPSPLPKSQKNRPPKLAETSSPILVVLTDRKLKKLFSNQKNARGSQPKAVYTGEFWAPEKSSRHGIWSIRDDLQIPSSPYFPAYAQGQGPPPMVQERFQSRIIRCGGAVDDDMANIIVAQLLYLDAVDPEKDIVMYVNSPGGSVTAGNVPIKCICDRTGMAIFDTMRHIRPDVSTVCVGLAARYKFIDATVPECYRVRPSSGIYIFIVACTAASCQMTCTQFRLYIIMHGNRFYEH